MIWRSEIQNCLTRLNSRYQEDCILSGCSRREFIPFSILKSCLCSVASGPIVHLQGYVSNIFLILFLTSAFIIAHPLLTLKLLPSYDPCDHIWHTQKIQDTFLS